jgi:hypothetical protein
MKVTDWRFVALLITENPEAGNMLAHICASEPDDPEAELNTFNERQRLALSSAPETAVAYYAEVACKSTLHGVVQALKSGAGYDDPRLDYLKAAPRNLTPELWAMASGVFVAADSYQYIQDDGTKTPDHDAMTELAAAHGYVIVEVE